MSKIFNDHNIACVAMNSYDFKSDDPFSANSDLAMLERQIGFYELPNPMAPIEKYNPSLQAILLKGGSISELSNIPKGELIIDNFDMFSSFSDLNKFTSLLLEKITSFLQGKGF